MKNFEQFENHQEPEENERAWLEDAEKETCKVLEEKLGIICNKDEKQLVRQKLSEVLNKIHVNNNLAEWQDKAFHALAGWLHPDNLILGDNEKMTKINIARDSQDQETLIEELAKLNAVLFIKELREKKPEPGLNDKPSILESDESFDRFPGIPQKNSEDTLEDEGMERPSDLPRPESENSED